MDIALTVFCGAIALMAGAHVLGWLIAPLGEIQVVDKLGDAGRCSVFLADVARRRMVQLVLYRPDDGSDMEVQMYLTATEAQLLSRWLRLAARSSPGTRRRSRASPGR